MRFRYSLLRHVSQLALLNVMQLEEGAADAKLRRADDSARALKLREGRT